MAIDHIVYNLNSGLDPSDAVPSADLVKLPPTDLIPPTKVGESLISPNNVEKYPLPHFVSSPLTIRPLFRRARRHIWRQLWEKPDIPPSATQLTLRRMVRTRRLVTALGRLLGTKSDVVTQIRKRLMRSAQGDTGEALEVAIYMGDVQGRRFRDAESLGSFMSCFTT
jgi:magnesium transporter